MYLFIIQVGKSNRLCLLSWTLDNRVEPAGNFPFPIMHHGNLSWHCRISCFDRFSLIYDSIIMFYAGGNKSTIFMCVQFTSKKSGAQQRLSISIKPGLIIVRILCRSSMIIMFQAIFDTETPLMQNGTIRTTLGYRNHLDRPEAVKRLV